VAGLLVGALHADRLVRRLGTKLTVALGFVVLAGGLTLGSQTSLVSSELFIAGWMALAGVGVGITLATTASAALSELSAEKAGVGSGVMQALKNVGAPFGAAILGSALSTVYQSHLHLAGLPVAATGVVRSSVFGGLAVAGKLASRPLLHTVRGAFVSGMDAALWVSVGFACVGVVCALIFLPSKRVAPQAAIAAAPQVDGKEEGSRELVTSK
jgi:DHA2 family multidrug resistance protein-like MFS transporter